MLHIIVHKYPNLMFLNRHCYSSFNYCYILLLDRYVPSEVKQKYNLKTHWHGCDELDSDIASF